MSELDFFNYLVRSIYSSNDFIPLHEPRFTGKEKENLIETIDSTFVSSVGQFVDGFENQLELYTKAGRAAAIVNGTSAIQVALRIAGVERETEVLTQALTFVATVNAINYNHAYPVFVDVDYDTMGLSPQALDDFLNEFGELREGVAYNKSSGRRISAILPMHTFGFMSRIEQIVELGKKWSIPVVEDSAESLGSFTNNRSSGTFGQLGAFSFNGNKIITSGGGGAIVSAEKKYADKAKYLTNTAKVPHPWEYYHDELGYNFRMPNVNAAIASAQLENLDKFIASKKTVHELYCSELRGKFKIKNIPEGTEWNYWLSSIEFENKELRDQFLTFTNENQVMTRPIWKLMFELPMYSDCQKDEQVNAIYLADRIVNIPSSVRI